MSDSLEKRQKRQATGVRMRHVAKEMAEKASKARMSGKKRPESGVIGVKSKFE